MNTSSLITNIQPDYNIIPPTIRPKFMEGKEEKDYVLHYDIETHKVDKYGRLKANAVGFYGSFTGYEYIVGDNCMERFVERLRKPDMKKYIWLNAFSGSQFDHHFLIQAEIKYVNLSVINPVHTPGGIIRANVAGMIIIDISKHLVGTLRMNLVNMGCTVTKGDFDYEKNRRWDEMDAKTQKDLLDYLERDVRGLKELADKLHDGCMKSYQTSWIHFYSASQMTYALWCDNIRDRYIAPCLIEIPNCEQWSFIQQSIYGGRSEVYRKHFESKDDYRNVTDKEGFDKIKDYLIDLDCVSLYPYSMLGDFPLGHPYKTSSYVEGKLGIYSISYIPNKKLLTPVLPRRTKDGIRWDLIDGEGVYTSVDIENARKFGYEITIIEGIVWPKKGPVFKDYIEKMFKRKNDAKKGSAEYTLAKLFMNGLYGKTGERPRFSKTFFLDEGKEWINILNNYYLDSIDNESFDDVWIVRGTKKTLEGIEKAISKPSQLCAFVLAYSRRHMMINYDLVNPHNKKELQHYYTDTDSIQVHVSQIGDVKMGKEMGNMTNGLGENTKIVEGEWVAPKMYILRYLRLMEDGKVELKEHRVCKGVKKIKGEIPLEYQDYKNMNKGETIAVNYNEFHKFGYDTR